MPCPAAGKDYYQKQKNSNFAVFGKIGTAEEQAR